MLILESINSLRQELRHRRTQGQRIAFVPTMGNLHAGHLRLVEVAKAHADVVVVSIFVNPLQFGPQEDFELYPRTLTADIKGLRTTTCDILFTPAVSDIYSGSANSQVQVVVPGISDDLCGKFRPGHFTGVCTVVAKLFNIVQPDVAVFGEKDFQQLLIIRCMATSLNFPVYIIGVPTIREADSLALSSRNQYLSPAERTVAPKLYQTLQRVIEKINAGDTNYVTLEQAATQELLTIGFKPDYVVIRAIDTLALPQSGNKLVVLAAAYLGKTRLIDNIKISGEY